MQALLQMVAQPGVSVITAEAITAISRLAASAAGECATLAERFPKAAARNLLQAFPAFALEQMYAEAGIAIP